ncbi:MAG: alpha/beta hydrolase [Planctomycetaceae bacterium]|nr:alpha/beta hydrolase [Planctomycetaceae bacterium]
MSRDDVGVRLISCVFALILISPELAVSQTPLVRKTTIFREVDGHQIFADVYRPEGDAILPVIVWIHGGGLIMGHREGIQPQIRALAEEKGYALVSIDYRLAPETKLPELISDIEAAFVWLAGAGAKEFHLDPNRIVVAGGSAGGYLTLVTGYRVTPKPKALVSLYGYGDLIGDWYSTPSPHPRHNFQQVSREDAEKQTDGTIVSDARHRKGNGGMIYLYYRQHGIWPEQVSGFSREEIAEKIAPYEPVRNVTLEFPPTLLIHGTSDTDVPYEESTMMVDEFRKHGVPHILKPIDNGEHGFGGGDPEQIEQAFQTMREFIIKHLEGA